MKYYHSESGFEFVLTEEKEISFETHNHVSKYVAGIVLDGSVLFEEKGQGRECVRDDMFVIPAYVAHALKISDRTTKVLTLCVDTDFLEKHTEAEGMKRLHLDTDKFLQQGMIDGTQAEAFDAALWMMFDLYRNGKNIPKNIEEICQRVTSEPEAELHLEEMAEQIYISKYYMLRQFKEKIGMTPHSFQIQNRIRKAQKLLEEGWLVADVAVQMGFYDQSHFVKSFKNLVGVTPSEYIESQKKI